MCQKDEKTNCAHCPTIIDSLYARRESYFVQYCISHGNERVRLVENGSMRFEFKRASAKYVGLLNFIGNMT